MDTEQIKRAFPGGLKKRRHHNSEAKMHTAVCDYLRLQHPGVRFISSLTGEYQSSEKIRQRNAAIQWGPGQPDILIIKEVKPFCGLALELKKEGSSPWKKNGELKAGEHLQNQQGWLNYMADQGWACNFAVGLDDAIDQIDFYLR